MAKTADDIVNALIQARIKEAIGTLFIERAELAARLEAAQAVPAPPVPPPDPEKAGG